MACTLFTVLRLFWLVIGVLAVTVKPDEDQDTSKISMCELSLAQLLLLPPDSIQVQALKRELFRYLEEKIEADELTKRSFASLVRDGNLPYVPKRSIEALARSGFLKSATPMNDYQDENMKRSIANLAKNGQLPTFQRPDDEQTQTKRGIESLARNGDLHGKRKLENLLEDLYGKRNIASLARGFNYPVAGKRYIGALARSGELRYNSADDDDYEKRNIASIVRNGKRNVQSLVRTNNLPGGKRYYLFDELKRNIASLARTMGSRYTGKRAVPTAALLRQDGLMKPVDHHHYDDVSSKSSDNNANNENESMEKRNIASLKSQMKSAKFKRSANENETSTRNKRQADYWEPSEEYPVPVYQNNNVYDYEELMQSLAGEYPNQEKRFLGSIARGGGWYRSPSRFRSPSKRHIGALARLGWLPAFRTVRRFNRSGRSANEPLISELSNEDADRSYSSDGTTEINSQLTEEPLNEAAKRYLLLPAVDNILLRKLYSNTQTSNQDLL